MALGLPTPTLADTRDLRAAPLDLDDAPDDVPPRLHEVGTHLIRVLIADGQPVVRAGLRAVLEREQDIAVVGEAATGTKALAIAQELRPDVVFLDADLCAPDVLEVTRLIVGDPRHAGARVMILAARDADAPLFEALRAGASGFLVKHSEPDDLVEAVRVLATGEALLSPGATRRLIAEFASQPHPHLPDCEQLEELTAREREVMMLVATGLSNEEIAERLFISPATAKTHVSRARCKLDVRDRSQLVAVAYQLGLVPAGHGRVARPTPAAPGARGHLMPARRIHAPLRGPTPMRVGGGRCA
jgi:DNA-binding NarL/FixJ family response regulator